ncbi:hypothetical protein SARC_09796 [Sphaeroforma arctica JP610]|uniref:Uncharacterized protein n=1 Tax=Sphaeroforma arctica JP610 TaxID=667725 RepID=A0A0L0FML8_9EUKA|nr:hypothetical protein SARC_09796 [Sphaeroforma arctica JP610]KNC77751.1 hypothetical protein SARC_09796 [Sphaeroforma arctica JP610]|eukprot:XP_014151653.1 hypothetical protein SARC_09796 [Sphaeroforma arctica JP610]
MTTPAWRQANLEAKKNSLNVHVLNGYKGYLMTDEIYNWTQTNIVEANIANGNAEQYVNMAKLSQHFIESNAVFQNMWDSLHFYSWVYAEFSQVFLNILAAQ